jgi:hypothetical protein
VLVVLCCTVHASSTTSVICALIVVPVHEGWVVSEERTCDPGMIPVLRVATLAALARHLRPRQRLLGFDFCGPAVLVAASDRERTQAAPFGVFSRSTDGVQADATLLNQVFEQAREFDAHGQVNIGAIVVNVDSAPQDENVCIVPSPPPALAEYVEALARSLDKAVDTDEERAQGLAIVYWNQAHVLRTVRAQVQDLRGVIHELELYPEREKISAAENNMEKPEPFLRLSLLRRMLFGNGEGIPSRRLRKALHRRERRHPGSYHDPKREEKEAFARTFGEEHLAVHEILVDVIEELRQFSREDSSEGASVENTRESTMVP